MTVEMVTIEEMVAAHQRSLLALLRLIQKHNRSIVTLRGEVASLKAEVARLTEQ